MLSTRILFQPRLSLKPRIDQVNARQGYAGAPTGFRIASLLDE